MQFIFLILIVLCISSVTIFGLKLFQGRRSLFQKMYLGILVIASPFVCYFIITITFPNNETPALIFYLLLLAIEVTLVLDVLIKPFLKARIRYGLIGSPVLLTLSLLLFNQLLEYYAYKDSYEQIELIQSLSTIEKEFGFFRANVELENQKLAKLIAEIIDETNQKNKEIANLNNKLILLNRELEETQVLLSLEETEKRALIKALKRQDLLQILLTYSFGVLSSLTVVILTDPNYRKKLKKILDLDTSV